MFDGVTEFTSALQGDSAEFMKKMQALVVGVVRDYEPARLYVIRIDNWFGPKWMHFAGKVSVGKHFYAGIHKVDTARAAVCPAPSGCRASLCRSELRWDRRQAAVAYRVREHAGAYQANRGR